MLLILALSCGGTPVPAEPTFVRGGVIAPAGSGGRAVGGARELITRDWKPGEHVALPTAAGDAPARPECVALFHVPLGDVSRQIASGGEAPDTAMAFSPDGSKLAIGAYTGEIVVVDGWTGAELARRTLPEALVKRVAWAKDGGTLYVGEQSPDAMVRALDPATLADRWTKRFADDVGASPAPRGDDLYGVYQLPGVYELEVTQNGGLIVTAVHGWTDADGHHRNASRVVSLASDGSVRAAWPADGPADATLLDARYDPDGPLIAVHVGRSSDGDPPAELPIGAVLTLDGATLAPRARYAVEPLKPWFDRVFAWDAVDVSVPEDLVVTGLGDGRVFAWHLDGTLRATLDPGVPIDANGVPIAASVGFTSIIAGSIVAETSGTTIPYGAADPSLRPPRTHPNENALWSWSPSGDLQWTWHGPWRLQGMTASEDGKTLVVGAGERDSDARTDLFGALVFRLDGAGTGDDRLTAICPTAGPVFFRQAMAPDGRIALSEHPWRDGTAVDGVYQVTVVR